MPQRIGVVGGGIVGLAVARELTRRHDGVEVVVFDKEDRLAPHQSGHNSGVVHAGIYYQPGSLKARLCTRGRGLLEDYVAEHRLPYRRCGKLVVAVEPEELGRFDALERTATANQVPGLTRVGPREMRDLEPYAAGLAALHSPATAITDYVAVAGSFAREITNAGGRILLSTKVTGIRHQHFGVEVATASRRYRVDRLVVCAGLQADRVCRLADGVDGPRIVPFRGEYLRVTPAKQHLVRGMVYPVPDPRYPFLGVHFTRRVTGELEVGPNAVLALRREGYRRAEVSLADLAAIATWPGSWRMARRHWRTGVREVRGSLSLTAYLEQARRYVPAITTADVARAGCGIRAQAVDRAGGLLDDFQIGQEDGITTVRNAPSPAATSSLAIAEFIVDRMTGAPAG
ncbi:MAG: L-2-hydroxyglutarate oxidase [Tetrasphaera sp.]